MIADDKRVFTVSRGRAIGQFVLGFVLALIFGVLAVVLACVIVYLLRDHLLKGLMGRSWLVNTLLFIPPFALLCWIFLRMIVDQLRLRLEISPDKLQTNRLWLDDAIPCEALHTIRFAGAYVYVKARHKQWTLCFGKRTAECVAAIRKVCVNAIQLRPYG